MSQIERWKNDMNRIVASGPIEDRQGAQVVIHQLLMSCVRVGYPHGLSLDDFVSAAAGIYRISAAAIKGNDVTAEQARIEADRDAEKPLGKLGDGT